MWRLYPATQNQWQKVRVRDWWTGVKPNNRESVRDAGCGVRDAGCEVRDAGCEVRGAGCEVGANPNNQEGAEVRTVRE